MMTVTEFAKAYGIDRNTVYSATWLVKKKPVRYHNREYEEEELRDAVRESVKRRAEKLREDLQKAEEILMKCSV